MLIMAPRMKRQTMSFMKWLIVLSTILIGIIVQNARVGVVDLPNLKVKMVMHYFVQMSVDFQKKVKN